MTRKKTKNFGRHKFTWLHIAENRLLISGMVFEKNDWVGWAQLKKSYLSGTFWKDDLNKIKPNLELKKEESFSCVSSLLTLINSILTGSLLQFWRLKGINPCTKHFKTTLCSDKCQSTLTNFKKSYLITLTCHEVLIWLSLEPKQFIVRLIYWSPIWYSSWNFFL